MTKKCQSHSNEKSVELRVRKTLAYHGLFDIRHFLDEIHDTAGDIHLIQVGALLRLSCEEPSSNREDWLLLLRLHPWREPQSNVSQHGAPHSLHSASTRITLI